MEFFFTKIEKRFGGQPPLCFFWFLWQERNQRYIDGILTLRSSTKRLLFVPFSIGVTHIFKMVYILARFY